MTARLIFFLLAGAVFVLLCIQPVMADEAADVAMEKIAHVDILQGTNKVGWRSVDWRVYGTTMKEKGYLNEAKEAYYKSYNSMVKYETIENSEEETLISGIADIEVEQGNSQKALELYDKICPDASEKNVGLLGKKAMLVRSLGYTARADALDISYRRLSNRPTTGGWGIVSLDPLIIIIGLIGAVLIIAKKHPAKQ